MFSNNIISITPILMYKCILPMLQVGPLKPVDEQSQVKPPLPSLEHSPLFLQGLEPQGSTRIVDKFLEA